MRSLLLRQFRTSNVGSLHEAWLALEQTSSVAEYRRNFIELIAPLENVPEPIALGQFLNGLKKEIRAEVRVLGPRFLEQAMDLALKVEEKSKYFPSHRGNTGSYKSQGPFQNMVNRPSPSTQLTPLAQNRNFNLPPTQKNPSLPSTSHNPHTQTRTFNRPRRLTETELQYRRENNLCFRCDGKWEAGHRCQNKELSVILIGDSVEEIAEENEEEESEKEEVEVNAAEVSLCSVVGLTGPKTMKLLGKIGGDEVQIMIDSGATHNFISLLVVERLKIPVEQGGAFRVSLGTGTVAKGKGYCRGVRIEVQGVSITEDYLPLELGNSDVILGVQWLEKLGEITTNWKSLLMKFRHEGRIVELRGEAAMGKTQISVKAMVRTLQREKGGILLEAYQVEEETGEPESMSLPPFLQEVVARYREVFAATTDLPPRRGREHAIILKQGSNPVSVRPYRYPQVQKDEIEKLIREMLAAGIIQPSTSPFSSPVLLVRKKDGGWRFCVDYRALNRETVADKYPIPVIEELLDELQGAAFIAS
ncbi:uncharacterized protein LOC130592079 [Beta vulgaris subsp. vulgaris]|uniref:uncharacterized protein LOC130592079 n=1 Tax=Beta vulgaris subsp. vulgaris TaxID=3555 RepID=UPI002546E780|nr:uncharacterized protein LOC130592079 [Beta vulgaris subsp. vulgaris]